MKDKPSGPQSVTAALGLDPSLMDIATRAKALADLDVQLRNVLPAATAKQCHLLNVRDGNLVVMARSPVFAARVRLAQDKLMAKANALGLEVTRVVTRVGGWDLPIDDPPVGKPLSRKAAAELKKTAATLGKDDPLGDVLRKLAATVNRATRSGK